MGEGVDTRNWIAELAAVPVIVVPNRLGAVNQARLVLEALPKAARARAMVGLMSQPRKDVSAPSNAKLLREFAPETVVVHLPWVGRLDAPERNRSVSAALSLLLKGLHV